MEEKTLSISEVPIVKVVEEIDSNIDPIKVTTEAERKKEEDETNFEGEFRKVEKESIAGQKPYAIEQSSSSSSRSREFLESQEKVKELELELERVAKALTRSESENTRLNNEVSLTKEENARKYGELELNHKKLQDQILEIEEKYSVQLNILQAALEAQETNQKELIGVKEAFDGVNLELKSSKKKMLKVEQELQVSTGEVLKFEELHKQSGLHAEVETKKALEFERLLEMATMSAKEVENQMAILQEEVKGLYEKIAENEKVEEALKVTSFELSTVHEKFEVSHKEVVDLEKRLELKENLISELTQELDMRKVSEAKVKEDLLGVENVLLLTKEELQEKVSELEDMKLNLNEEVSAKDLIQEEMMKITKEKEVLESQDLIQEEMTKITKEKEVLESRFIVLEQRNLELELELKTSTDKYGRCIQLEAEVESFELKTSSLEVALQMANEKEKELIENVKIKTEEKRNIENALKSSTEKLVESENLVHVLRNELNLTQQRLESIEADLKAAGMRETKVMEKLKFAEDEIEKHGSALEQAKSRSLELEFLHDTVTKDSELKLQEAIANFSSRDFEAKSLYEKVQALEDQVMIYKEHSANLKEELDQISEKLDFSEKINEELKRKISEAEDKAAQSFSENELLVETSTQLKSKINELQELLNLEYYEKEANSQQLSSHLTTISELNDQHSKASELAESHKIELEQTLKKLKETESIVEKLQTKSGESEKENEGLAGVNLKLTQYLAAYESKLNDLQTILSDLYAEKDESIEWLRTSKTAAEDLKQQISALMEENSLLTETHQNAKTELQNVVLQLEGQLKEQKLSVHALKAEIENLKAEIDEKSVLKDRLKNSEGQLGMVEAQVKAEKVENSEKDMEIYANKEAILLLENQVKELEQKLQLADAKTNEEDIGASSTELKEGMEVKSRDIGSRISTPLEHKHKKKFEATSVQSSSSSDTRTTAVSSSGMTFKFILGVALVSVIVGVILGKRY